MVILLHGRGAGADDILGLAGEFESPDLAFLAPQAANSSWYPYSFLAPIDQNEPWLTSATWRWSIGWSAGLAAQGVARDRVVLAGFSQGACLSLEYAVRHAGRYGGVVGLSGGVIGPDGTGRDYAGSFDRTPVFLGCSDVDPHIPAARVNETAEDLHADGSQCRQAALSRNGAHRESRRDRTGARHARVGRPAASALRRPPPTRPPSRRASFPTPGLVAPTAPRHSRPAWHARTLRSRAAAGRSTPP